MKDIPGLLRLLSQLGHPCELEDWRTRFLRFAKNPGYGVAVSKIKREIVGLVAWSRSDLLVLDRVRLHIEGLTVAEKCRGRRIS
jgi:hypothetical protein